MALRVLIVDDSPVMRGFVRRVLGISGLSTEIVLEASDGEEALDMLESNGRMDLILTDVNMPNMNGEEFVEQLVARGILPAATVVVVSTDSTPARIEHLRNLGARGYLPKPFVPEALRAEVEIAMGGGHVE